MKPASNSFQDAEKAFEYGVQGIVLSNHGGRQLDLSVHYFILSTFTHSRTAHLHR